MKKKPQPQKNTKTTPDQNNVSYPVVAQSGVWKTDYAWISGVAGALSVLLLAAIFNRYNLLNTGLSLGGVTLFSGQLDAKLFALGCVCAVMLIVEFIRLWLWDKKHFFHIHPLLKRAQYGGFALECIVNFAAHLLLFALVLVFFRSAGEYGYVRDAAYYKAWFRFLDLAWSVYLWFGLPYVFLTRALKYDAEADKRDYSTLVKKVLSVISAKLLRTKAIHFDDLNKKSLRGLLVKLFFAPLMTVFFIDQFGHLVNNMGYLLHLVNNSDSITYTINKFNSDVYNLSHAFIFSIDVALAWCGYVVSSRWVDNQTISAEPTLLGWVVCIFCYPPFNTYLGLYYSAPSERMILQGQEHLLVAFFTVLMALSYLVYMSATLWFGVRFSNLTNRGIIRKGPFAIIRHPAYASKNFAWWCVMFPAIILNLVHSGNWSIALTQTAGLVLMTWFYYMRAMTEERHLAEDPAYLAYCKQVKYRFIPGVL
ncbi:MAG: hypothetical protein KTR17_11230 [Cellvibrionaceae bacterium]|nr:hypothetical protein [Cellvibrionaceae bacterium]